MDSKFKGIVWVGNIYQRFEALCLEMDDMVCQETFQYVEDQLQTVGANVRQFCTELMQEVLPSSPTNSKEELNLSLLQNAAGQSTENERGLAQACKDEAHDTDFTLDDALLQSKGRYSFCCCSPAPVPSLNKVKLEESCIVVDSSELHSLSNELQERRSFKEAFSLKSSLWKPDDEQHRNSVEQSGKSNKSESQEMGFSESDWEII
ncbi:hypothetical protein J1N35_034062 [Gossypium stocksii]|uniref:Uncharacterized protein n=1 Tax=Gossypium stocksii TaxID=47602 RepID=A0A9D3URD4_9ROSI|nr:hypothetical protein J1N35_034062 [Gossypium stocksii]